MRIPLNSVKRLMQDNMQNKKSISMKAIFFMTQKLESFVIEKTKQVEEKLKEENNLRKIQGLSEKKRVSEELLNEVLKS